MMKISPNAPPAVRVRRAALSLLLLGGALRAAAQLEPGQTIQQFRLPDYDRDGQLKSQLFGDQARVLNADEVEVTNLRIELYEGTQVTTRVSAPQCLYHRKQNAAASDGAIRIARENAVITGERFTWRAGDNHFLIESNAQVVIRGALKPTTPRKEPAP